MAEESNAGVSAEANAVQVPTREALLKDYDAEKADALLALEQKLDGRGDETASDPEAAADAVTAEAAFTNGS